MVRAGSGQRPGTARGRGATICGGRPIATHVSCGVDTREGCPRHRHMRQPQLAAAAGDGLAAGGGLYDIVSFSRGDAE